MTALPRPGASRLQNFVATLLRHGNTPDNLDLDRLARFNRWTDAGQLLDEFKIQQNGRRKLPEEVAISSKPTPKIQEVDE